MSLGEAGVTRGVGGGGIYRGRGVGSPNTSPPISSPSALTEPCPLAFTNPFCSSLRLPYSSLCVPFWALWLPLLAPPHILHPHSSLGSPHTPILVVSGAAFWVSRLVQLPLQSTWTPVLNVPYHPGKSEVVGRHPEDPHTLAPLTTHVRTRLTSAQSLGAVIQASSLT